MGVLVFVGCFLVLFGHRAFGLTQAIFGVYLVSMVAYPVSVGVFSAQHALALVASAGAGLLGKLTSKTRFYKLPATAKEFLGFK